MAGEQIALGLDCAASEFYKDGKYHLEGEAWCCPPKAQWTNILATWVDKYPIIHRGRHGRRRLGRLEAC